MKKNFLVGIGGSGARVAEASLFLSASGFGPDKLSLILIDPDKGNGNLGRTTRLISKYLECKKYFQPLDKRTNIFQTELVVPKLEKDRVWGIFTKSETTLSEWIGYDGLKDNNNANNKAEYDFMSVLFSKDELSTKLDKGFRGHPAIGSVVMTKIGNKDEMPNDEYPFKLLWDEMPDSKVKEVQLFLVGSVFGGTGAAGFPTLGHNNVIKFNKDRNTTIDEKEKQSRVLLGGALILPYFKVVKSDNIPGMYVSSDDFPIATKAALEFYDTKENLGFDEIYFIGDSLSHAVGDFSVGSTSQENKPHYIEVVSSLAAFDFFNQGNSEKEDSKPKYFIARREDQKVNWMSFPVSRNEDIISSLQNNLKYLTTIMTVFCYSLVTYGRSILTPEDDSKNKDQLKHPWYDNFNFSKNDEYINPRTSLNKETLRVFIDFAEDYLDWITSISDYSNVELIDNVKFSEGERKWKNPVNLSLIGEILKESPKNKNGWVTGAGGFLHALNSEKINKNIKENAKSMTAANKFINLFYDAAREFASNTFTITPK